MICCTRYQVVLELQLHSSCPSSRPHRTLKAGQARGSTKKEKPHCLNTRGKYLAGRKMVRPELLKCWILGSRHCGWKIQICMLETHNLTYFQHKIYVLRTLVLFIMSNFRFNQICSPDILEQSIESGKFIQLLEALGTNCGTAASDNLLEYKKDVRLSLVWGSLF